jgi:hypothetical protein
VAGGSLTGGHRNSPVMATHGEKPMATDRGRSGRQVVRLPRFRIGQPAVALPTATGGVGHFSAGLDRRRYVEIIAASPLAALAKPDQRRPPACTPSRRRSTDRHSRRYPARRRHRPFPALPLDNRCPGRRETGLGGDHGRVLFLATSRSCGCGWSPARSPAPATADDKSKPTPSSGPSSRGASRISEQVRPDRRSSYVCL